MERQGDEVHIEDDEARAGETSGHMRWVLGIGLFLAIALLSLIWITGALSQGDVEEEATVSSEQRSMADDGDDTDSIVIDEADEIEGAGEVEGADIVNE